MTVLAEKQDSLHIHMFIYTFMYTVDLNLPKVSDETSYTDVTSKWETVFK